ncbi:hypothetical protein [Streptomyces sp. NPDC001594]
MGSYRTAAEMMPALTLDVFTRTSHIVLLVAGELDMDTALTSSRSPTISP